MAYSWENLPASAPDYSGGDSGGGSGAGIAQGATAAAVATMNAIAGAASNKAAVDAKISADALGRASSEQLAKMRLSAEGEKFDKQLQSNAYQELLKSLSQQNNTAFSSRTLQRKASSSMDQFLSRAFLGR